MPTFNTPPANPLDYGELNVAFGSTAAGQFYSLGALEASNVDGEAITQRPIDVRSCVKVFGPVAATYTRDYKQNPFSGEAPAMYIPGASVSFVLKESCSRVQFMYQLSWQGLISTPPETDPVYIEASAEEQVAALRIYLDGEPYLWNTDHKLPYSVARFRWGGRRGKAEPFFEVGPSVVKEDVDPARQRTVSGFVSLGNLQAGEHHVGLAVWYDGHGMVRIRSSQVAVIARYR